MWQKFKESFLNLLNTVNSWSLERKVAVSGLLITIAGLFLTIIIWRNPVPTPPSAKKCTLENDDPRETKVQARTNCDRFSCDDNPSTAIGSYPNGTEVQRTNSVVVKGKRFNWVQVTLVSRGNSFWVAESKLSCRDIF